MAYNSNTVWTNGWLQSLADSDLRDMVDCINQDGLGTGIGKSRMTRVLKEFERRRAGGEVGILRDENGFFLKLPPPVKGTDLIWIK